MEKTVTVPVDATELDKQLQQEAFAERKEKKGVDYKPGDLNKSFAAAYAKPDEEKVEEPKEKEAPDENKPEKVDDTQPVEKEAAPVEEQPAEKETAPDDKATKQPTEKAEEPFSKRSEEAYIKSYAEREGLSTKEAKEELDGMAGLIKKYGGDPENPSKSELEFAKANRRQQSAYDKNKVEMESRVRESAIPQLLDNPRQYLTKVVSNLPEPKRVEIINAYRSENPARARDMEDDAVLEAIVEYNAIKYESQQKEFSAKLKVDAGSKRDELLNSVPEAEKRFIPVIKKTLMGLPDHQVMSPGFKFEDLRFWAKGQFVDDLVKEAEERAGKNASEQKRIVGTVPKSNQSSQPVIKKKAAIEPLTDSQKKRAFEMYDGTGMTEDEMYEEYSNVVLKRKQK